MWSDIDFEEMSWHDNFVHSVSFPDEKLLFTLDIDYILEWINMGEFFHFKVAPAILTFTSVFQLKMSLDFNDSVSLYIEKIERSNKRLSPNKEVYLWDYTIQTDQGEITFTSTGFTQTLKAESHISDSQRYRRVDMQ